MIAFLAVLAAGCGSASSTSTSTSKSTSRTAANRASSRPDPNAIPTGSVAVVLGTPITETALNHWMYVAAKSQAAQSPGQAVIVPDPPAYKSCVAQGRKKVPDLKKASTKTLLANCRQIFLTLSSQAMDFLIKADWIQADGARHGIVPTAAQVAGVYTKAKQQQFPGGKGYEAFLAETGQTDQDVRFRFRITFIFGRLTAREKGTTDARQTAVENREKRLFTGQTRCAMLVLMADCGNYRKG